LKRIFKNLKSITLSILVLANILIFAVAFNYNNILGVVFLDVGQGDSIYIKSPVGNQILIDGGPNGKVLERLGQVMPFYDRTIDSVISTHPDLDHIGGLPSVMENYKVGEYFNNDSGVENDLVRILQADMKESGTKGLSLTRNMVLDLGGGTYLRIFSPLLVSAGTDTNKNSIVAKLYYGNTSFLFTGDAPLEVEDYLAKTYGMELDSQVLKVAHHGSKNSLSESFLSVVSPDFSVISASINNRYGHPHKEVLDFLENIKSKILETSVLGNIKMESNGQEIKVK
jgi:competence protein ComEC